MSEALFNTPLKDGVPILRGSGWETAVPDSFEAQKYGLRDKIVTIDGDVESVDVDMFKNYLPEIPPRHYLGQNFFANVVSKFWNDKSIVTLNESVRTELQSMGAADITELLTLARETYMFLDKEHKIEPSPKKDGEIKAENGSISIALGTIPPEKYFNDIVFEQGAITIDEAGVVRMGLGSVKQLLDQFSQPRAIEALLDSTIERLKTSGESAIYDYKEGNFGDYLTEVLIPLEEIRRQLLRDFEEAQMTLWDESAPS